MIEIEAVVMYCVLSVLADFDWHTFELIIHQSDVFELASLMGGRHSIYGKPRGIVTMRIIHLFPAVSGVLFL